MFFLTSAGSAPQLVPAVVLVDHRVPATTGYKVAVHREGRDERHAEGERQASPDHHTEHLTDGTPREPAKKVNVLGIRAEEACSGKVQWATLSFSAPKTRRISRGQNGAVRSSFR